MCSVFVGLLNNCSHCWLDDNDNVVCFLIERNARRKTFNGSTVSEIEKDGDILVDEDYSGDVCVPF